MLIVYYLHKGLEHPLEFGVHRGSRNQSPQLPRNVLLIHREQSTIAWALNLPPLLKNLYVICL